MILNKDFPYFLFATLFLGCTSSWAEESVPHPLFNREINGETVVSSAQERDPVIATGKKRTQVELKNTLIPADQNFRKLYSEISGLNVTEVQNQSFNSMNFRGLGDPHEGFHVQALEDGVPIAADPYGYPAQYYTPPFLTLEQLEFFKNGQGLLFGPLPGGAVQYRTKSLRVGSPFAFQTQQTIGAFGYFGSHWEASKGISDTQAIRATLHHRTSRGFRLHNQDHRVDYLQLKHAMLLGPAVLTSKIDYQKGNFGEPGGLSNLSDPTKTTTPNDRLSVDRISANFIFEIQNWTTRFSVTDFNRESIRQNIGTAPVFGGTPNSNTFTLQDQDFLNLFLDSRKQMLWSLLETPLSTTLGATAFRSHSSFYQSNSSQRFLKRRSEAYSLFTETEVGLGKLKFIPGFRIENHRQWLAEMQNTAGDALRNLSTSKWIPLLGFGSEYSFTQAIILYASYQESYRPVLFQESIPLSPGTTSNGDILPSSSWTSEIGIKNSAQAPLHYDASAFLIRYENQLGRVGTNFQNVGAGRHYGIDGNISYAFQKFKLKSNLTFLNAKFTRGSVSGATPQYAPRFLSRSGFEHQLHRRVKYEILATAASRQFGDDSNSAKFTIPGYLVLDAQLEAQFFDGTLSWTCSFNNLLDRRYFSRVRPNGIDPAFPFTFQTGLKVDL